MAAGSGSQKLTGAELTLYAYALPYEKRPDGTLYVPGNIHLSKHGLWDIPDFTGVIVGGNFKCSDNSLTSLKGSPAEVRGNFICSSNELTSLEGGPRIVGGDYFVSNNKLTSLEGAPERVGGVFGVHDNQLENFEGAPRSFNEIRSDFGSFLTWNDVPEHLRYSPETKARREREQFLRTVDEVTQRAKAVRRATLAPERASFRKKTLNR